MDWDDYRFFLMVARAPSIRAAASKLGVSHSTVLRRVDRLEDTLGARLFERASGGFSLTPAGEDVLLSVKEIEESVQSIDRSVTGRDASLEGLVRVSMPEVMAHPLLFPDLSKLKEQFPNINLEIELSYGLSNLHKREADIAIRFTNSPPDDLVGRKVGEFAMAAYATQTYIDEHKPSNHDSTAQLIAYGNPDVWRPRHGFDHLSAMGFFDNISLQIDLANASLGIGSLPVYIADREPKLVRISEPTMHRDIWVLYHTDLRYTSRVRVVRDFFVDGFAELFGNYAH